MPQLKEEHQEWEHNRQISQEITVVCKPQKYLLPNFLKPPWIYTLVMKRALLWFQVRMTYSKT